MRDAKPVAAFPRTPPYSGYAAVYDAIGQRTFGERIAEATLAYLAGIDKRPTSAIDLACGTGSATLILAASGMRVTGIDRSAHMLDAARASAERAGLPVRWQEADMCAFTVEQPVELITAFYDAVNYLTEPVELDQLFRSTHEALTPGGLFVFDVNTREKFSAAWNNSCVIAVNRDDLFGVYQSWYQPEDGISPLLLTFFSRAEDGTWTRFDEEHIERAYPLDELTDRLASSGFQVREMRDYVDRTRRFGGVGSERSHRVVFVAERPE